MDFITVMAKETASSASMLYGGPTKRFFVSMLTRDIELADAILDLIDNSVDGAMRQSKDNLDQAAPFKGFVAELELSNGRFAIQDNCGGIPNDYVVDAFHLGRPNIDKDGDLPTVGMYGIGMKRAIFKIGSSASVISSSKDGQFSVRYTADWLSPDNDEWDLPIERSEASAGPYGVLIDIPNVKSEIGKRFENSAFINSLRNDISEHFAYLMQKGFSIVINGEPIKPKALAVVSSDHTESAEIRAFDYERLYDDVKIKVTIGFYRALSREFEIDEETESPKEADEAGVSVVCNDRVILLSDKTFKTGWGDGTVPSYHPQFRAVAGLIIFSSNNAEKLPISTTKRDLDVGEDVYLIARKAAMEGLKIFTNFTNKWKGREKEANEWFAASPRTDVKTGIRLAENHGFTVRGEPGAKKYVPTLPLPADKTPKRRISFVRDEVEISKVSEYLFDDGAQKPALVGEECFERILAEAKKK